MMQQYDDEFEQFMGLFSLTTLSEITNIKCYMQTTLPVENDITFSTPSTLAIVLLTTAVYKASCLAVRGA